MVLNSTISKISTTPIVAKDHYQQGLELIDVLVKDYRPQVCEIATKTLKKDCKFVSDSELKRLIKEAIKNQNVDFVFALSSLILKINSGQKLFDFSNPTMSNFNSLERKLGATGFTEEQENQIQAQMTSNGYNREEAIQVLGFTNIGGPAPSNIKTGTPKPGDDKKPIDWNNVIDSTGKVAQTIFYLGNIFSKKEDTTAPTMDEGDSKTSKAKNNTAAHIIIITVIVIGIVVSAYFLLRKKQK